MTSRGKRFGAPDGVSRPTADKSERGIPEATVARLPVYLRALVTLADRGIATCSSEALAAAARTLVDGVHDSATWIALALEEAQAHLARRSEERVDVDGDRVPRRG